MSQSGEPGAWDGSFYRVHTEYFEAAFLPNLGEDLEAVDNVDVLVDLPDGSRWSATIITLAHVELAMKRWTATGEALRVATSASRTVSSSAMPASAACAKCSSAWSRTTSSHRFFRDSTTDRSQRCESLILKRSVTSWRVMAGEVCFS